MDMSVDLSLFYTKQNEKCLFKGFNWLCVSVCILELHAIDVYAYNSVEMFSRQS